MRPRGSADNTRVQRGGVPVIEGMHRCRGSQDANHHGGGTLVEGLPTTEVKREELLAGDQDWLVPFVQEHRTVRQL